MNQPDNPILELEQQAALKQPTRYSSITIEDQALEAYHRTGNKQDYFDVFKKYYDDIRRKK